MQLETFKALSIEEILENPRKLNLDVYLKSYAWFCAENPVYQSAVVSDCEAQLEGTSKL